MAGVVRIEICATESAADERVAALEEQRYSVTKIQGDEAECDIILLRFPIVDGIRDRIIDTGPAAWLVIGVAPR